MACGLRRCERRSGVHFGRNRASSPHRRSLAGLADVAVDQRLVTQAVRRGAQAMRRDAKPRHDVVESSQVALQAVQGITQVGVLAPGLCLREGQCRSALRRVQGHETQPSPFRTFLDPLVVVGFPFLGRQAGRLERHDALMWPEHHRFPQQP